MGLVYPGSKVPLYVSGVLSETDYYYSVNTDLAQNTLTEDVTYNIKYKNSNIIFDLSYEGWKNSPKIIYSQFIKPYTLPVSKVILLSGSADIQDEISLFCNSVGIEKFKGLYIPSMMYDIANELRNKKHNLSNYYFKKYIKNKKGLYNKTFLNFNRRWRLHRPALVGLLVLKNLHTKALISLSKSDDNLDWNKTYEGILSLNTANKDFCFIWENNKQQLLSLPNMTLDCEDLTINRAGLDLTTERYYLESYFSVVSETNFYQSVEPARFLSEKTFKPIVFKHPFILASTPYCLDFLKDLGFKTFHPYINETYDYEMDDSKRLLMIIDEIERLSNLNNDEIINFLQNTTDIVEHNYNTLLGKVR